MAQPYLALRPAGNGLDSHNVVAGSKNPTVLTVGVSSLLSFYYKDFLIFLRFSMILSIFFFTSSISETLYSSVINLLT